MLLLYYRMKKIQNLNEIMLLTQRISLSMMTMPTPAWSLLVMNTQPIRISDLNVATFIMTFCFPILMFSFTPLQNQKVFSGKLIKKNSVYGLQVTPPAGVPTKYSLKYSSAVIETVIKRLDTDDFISVQGDESTTSNTEKTLTISSINYVGLNVLIGTWQGDDKVCYNFKNFTTLYIFNRTSSGACAMPLNTKDSLVIRKMNYFVNPDDLVWTLLISNIKTQYAAELFINNTKTVQLNLFDEQTGAIFRKTILRR